ncbi:MAG: DUF937 domain-containing protein [Saprospiraceae bacterium]
MDLMQMLQSQLSDTVLDQISGGIEADKQQTASAANGIFASILGGLAKNAGSSEGLSSLLMVLDRDHDGSILDDVAGIVGSMMQNQGNDNRALNGAGIIRHVLGDQQENMAQQISQSSGLQMSQVMKLMPILAPIVMGALGKAKNSGGIDLGGLAQALMGAAQEGGQQSGMQDMIGGLLGQALGGGQQQPGSGGGGLFGQILGGLLGKK